MSEYQYYEFQAVDHPLTQDQMSDLRAYEEDHPHRQVPEGKASGIKAAS